LNGTQALKNKELTNPKINAIYDTNGVIALTISAVASQVNSLDVYPEVSGSEPSIRVVGEANTGMFIQDSNGNIIADFNSAAAATDWVSIYNGGGTVLISGVGASANVTVSGVGKGTGKFNIDGNAATATAASSITSTVAGTAIAAQSAGGIGTYALMYNNAGTTLDIGATIAGSSLNFSSAAGSPSISASVGSGTWRCMGYTIAGSSITLTSLFLRIS